MASRFASARKCHPTWFPTNGNCSCHYTSGPLSPPARHQAPPWCLAGNTGSLLGCEVRLSVCVCLPIFEPRREGHWGRTDAVASNNNKSSSSSSSSPNIRHQLMRNHSMALAEGTLRSLKSTAPACRSGCPRPHADSPQIPTGNQLSTGPANQSTSATRPYAKTKPMAAICTAPPNIMSSPLVSSGGSKGSVRSIDL